MKRLSPYARGVICTTLGGVCWGFSGSCGQYLFSNFDITTLAFTPVRMIIAGSCLLLLALRNERAALAGIWREKKDAARLLLYGICGLMLTQFSYMTAIAHSNAATATVLQNLNLVFIMLITCVRLRRCPGRAEGLSLVLAVGGTYLLATGGDPHHMVLSAQGLFWGLVAAAGVTLYTLIAQPLLPKWGKLPVTGYGMVAGGLFLLLAGRTWRFYPVHLPLKGLLAAGAIILVGTVMALTLFMQGIADVGPVKASMLAATEPLSATVIAYLWLGTRFSAADLMGFACIIATVFLLARSGEEQPAKADKAG